MTFQRLTDAHIVADIAQAVRNDSRFDSNAGPIDVARAQMNAHISSIARLAAKLDDDYRYDADDVKRIASTLAIAAGYRRIDKETWAYGRNDASSMFTDELTDKDGRIRRPKQRKRALSSLIPTRSVMAMAERYTSRHERFEGEMTHIRPQTTQVTTVNSQVFEREREIHTFGIKRQVHWMQILKGSASALDQAASDLEAVNRIAADFTEDLLVKGIGDAISLWSLVDIPHVVRISLEEDYSAPVTAGAAFADLAKTIGKVLEAHEDRGEAPDTVWIGTRYLRKLVPINNIDAGGEITGADIRAKLATLFDDTGITRFIAAPSLNRFGGDDSVDAMVLGRTGNGDGLQQVSAMTLAPARSAETLLGSETLYVMRHGGLDIYDATDVAIITVKVA